MELQQSINNLQQCSYLLFSMSEHLNFATRFQATLKAFFFLPSELTQCQPSQGTYRYFDKIWER